MTGNATEEGLIQQIGNPSHLDRGRIAVPAGVLSGALTGFLMTGPLWLRGLVGLLVAVAIFALVIRHFTRRAMERQAQAQEAARAARHTDVERQIAAMMTKGGER
ncbi:MAG TPA: hypothetical protein DEA05_06365 [Rhodobacteraceae bacterium]|nr:hypothetical protein [Paracoccaceae bacterium]